MNHDPQRRFLLSNQPNDGSLTRDTPPCEGLTTESAVRKFPAIFLNADIERTDHSDLPTHQDLPIFSDPTGGTQAGGTVREPFSAAQPAKPADSRRARISGLGLGKRAERALLPGASGCQ
ncbi:MAG: hypothetical protein ACK5F7_14050 [Planctomycetaceae bacterium]